MKPARTTEHPGVSIVVPVRNAASTIGPCIDALLAQNYGGPFVIHVVDNDSRDETPRRLRSYAEAIRVSFEGTRGASAARNRGILESPHERIAFIDADCIARADWLRELVQSHLENPQATLVGGRIRARPSDSPIALWAETILDQESAILSYEPPYVITANAFGQRRDLIRCGLFHLDFLRSQDAEFSFRAGLRHGATFHYARNAVVEHVNIETLSELWAKALEHGTGSARLWREFQSELDLSISGRLIDTSPYENALRETAALARDTMLGRSRETTEHQDFFNALFRLGKQVGFTWGSLRGGWR